MRQLLAVMSILGMFGIAIGAQQQDGGNQSLQVCTLKISGMFCGACAKTVEKAAQKIDGVKLVRASQPKGVAQVTYDPAKTSPAAIAKTISTKTPFKAEVQTEK